MKSLGYDIEGEPFKPTLEQALARTKFDAIVAQANLYSNYANAMLDKKPTLKLLTYMNGTHTDDGTLNATWYLRDDGDNKVHAGDPWQKNFLMDVTSRGWIDYFIQRCLTVMQQSNYNAIYIDELGTGPITNTTSAPLGSVNVIDPATNDYWTLHDWMEALNSYLAEITAALDVPVFCNGLGNNVRFFNPDAPTSDLLASDGAVAELYMRGPTQDLNKWIYVGGFGNRNWIQEKAMVQACGPKFLGITKTWAEGTSLMKQQWHRYALTSFLVSADKNAHFYFTEERAATVTPFHPWWSRGKSLGTPEELGHQNGIGWSRTYTNGVVYVNPTGTALTFPGAIAGSRLTNTLFGGGSLIIPAYSGEIISEI